MAELDLEISHRRSKRPVGVSEGEQQARVKMMQEIRGLVAEALPAPAPAPRQEDLFG
ncbi:MAG: hypothetical protein ACO3PR_16575 [Limisphaerales bacterium]